MRVVGRMLSNAGASDSKRNDEFSATMGEKLNWVKRIKMVVKIKEIYRPTKLNTVAIFGGLTRFYVVIKPLNPCSLAI